MKIAARGFIGTLFALLVTVFILLITIRFEILNKSFLFGVFEKHNVYGQLPNLLVTSLPNDPNLTDEERLGYTEFAKNISPQVIKPLIEDNFGQVIDFLNGDSKDIVISFALNGVGFENVGSIRWSISQIPDKNTQEQIRSLNGIGNTLIIAWVTVFIVLVALFFLYGRLTTPKSWIGGKTLLLSSGVSIFTMSVFTKIALIFIGKGLVEGKEPAQKLLALLSTSLFSEITITWLMIGGMLILLWLIMKMWPARNKNPQTPSI